MTTHTAGADFDRFADDYEACCARGLALAGESKEHFARRRLQWLSKWLVDRGVPAPRRIIDFGCGVGDVTRLIASAFSSADVLGMDPSRDCVERARREHSERRVRFTAVDDRASWRDQRADLLHCNGVIHHVPPAERAAVVAQMASLVRPGGHVCVFENNPWNPGARWVMRRIPFDRDAQMIAAEKLRRLLRQTRARICDTGYLFFFPRALRALRFLEPSLLRVPLGAQYGVIGEVRSP